MIKGLYEAYLPVRDIERSIEFYNKLGLELAYKNELVTFFWLEKGKIWPCPASIRHVAFQ